MNFSYLTNVMDSLEPLMTRALPVIWTWLVLWRILKLVKQ